MTADLNVRRATVEDIPKLIPLWQAEQLPWADLEKRFKEFQVIESSDGELLGAVGVLIAGQEGWLHSEVFTHPEYSNDLRLRLWERIKLIAANHGLVRLWTHLGAPFWHSSGFTLASSEMVTRLPPAFGEGSRPWSVLQLKSEGVARSLDKEFALFREAEQERTQELLRKARVMKMIAAVISVALFVLVLVWAILFLKTQARLRGP